MNVSSQGWSSRGVMPAVQMALDHVNRDPVILPDFTLYEDWRDSKVIIELSSLGGSAVNSNGR